MMKLKSRLVIVAVSAGALTITAPSWAADLSLVSGLYWSESSKTDGTNTGSASHFGLNGRYHDDLSENLAWYGVGGVGMTSYGAPSGKKSPDNFVGLTIGGGIRHYFKPFTAGVVPFASGGGRIVNSKSVEDINNGFVETTTNGLRYEAAIGIRAGLDENFFAEIELPLFDNALFAVRKKVTVENATSTTPASETKDETTYSELWVDSSAALSAARVAVGYKF